VEEECESDAVHARLLSARVELHNGVWIVDDNVRLHDKFAVKLSVCIIIVFTKDVLNIRFIFTLVPNSAPNSVFVFRRIVSSERIVKSV